MYLKLVTVLFKIFFLPQKLYNIKLKQLFLPLENIFW